MNDASTTSTMDRQDAINADGAKCDQIAAAIDAALKTLREFGKGVSGHIEHDDLDAIRKALTKASDALDYAIEVMNELRTYQCEGDEDGECFGGYGGDRAELRAFERAESPTCEHCRDRMYDSAREHERMERYR